MPINNTTPIISYTGNGASTSFPYPFKIFKAADMIATIDGVTKTFGADYALTGIGDVTGGAVVFAIAPANGARVVLYRQVSYDRLTPDYQEGGDFLSDVLDDDIDRVVAQVQQIARDLGRAIKLPVDVTTDQTIISTAAQRIGKIAGFDNLGNATLFDPSLLSAATVSVYMATVLVAANAAAAAAALSVYSITQSDAIFIAKALVGAKGDLIGASANDTPVIISVGNDGLQLTADSSAGAGLSYAIRNLERSQCPIAGALDANGAAAFLTTGAGLRPGLDASPTALLLGFANGYDAGGNKDLASLLSADVGDILGADLPANSTSFIYADYTSPVAVTWGSTRIPQQMGDVFDKTKQSLLRFAGADASTSIIDDYGNTWAAVGNAQVDTAVQIDGLNTLLLDGTGDYVECTQFTTLGGGSWQIEAKVRFNVLPTAGNTMVIFNACNSAGATFGARLGLNNAAGTMKLSLALSSNTTSDDIAAATLGTSTAWATATTYHITFGYDALAGKYFVFKDGTVDQTVVSAVRVCGISKIRIGNGNIATAVELNGAVAGFRFSQYCRYPNGTAFAAPSLATFAVEGFWYSRTERKLYEATAASATAGINPTFTQRQRVYAGEADTSGAAVTAVRSYAYKGRYTSPDFAVPTAGVTQTLQHNIGVAPQIGKIYCRNYVSDNGWTPGEIGELVAVANATSFTYPVIGFSGRNSMYAIAGNAASPLATQSRSGGAGINVPPANWRLFATADRGF